MNINSYFNSKKRKPFFLHVIILIYYVTLISRFRGEDLVNYPVMGHMCVIFVMTAVEIIGKKWRRSSGLLLSIIVPKSNKRLHVHVSVTNGEQISI